MPQQVISSVENNFTKGLITESTGLNFPENAATATDNCTFTLVGDVTRRQGINLETNFKNTTINRTGCSENTYIWKNVGGDGLTQLLVVQIGGTLTFFSITNSSQASPISANKLTSSISLTPFVVSGNTFDPSIECQFSDGNGFLFVFHPQCDPFFCSYSSGVISSTLISVQIRDFIGAYEPGVPVNLRPSSLSNTHQYNLVNQGWITGSPWSLTSFGSPPTIIASGTASFSVPTGVTGISNGQQVAVATTTNTFPGGSLVVAGTVVMGGTVTGYAGGVLTINVTSSLGGVLGSQLGPYLIMPVNSGYINTWNAAEGNYPSNADVWWYFKNASNTFDPTTTVPQVTVNTGPAPQGHFILNAFNQQRSSVSGVAGLTDVVTGSRPSNGAWFQGRLWFTGVNAGQPAQGTANYYTWTENIYFSQVTISDPAQFGQCYQNNDPTSETLFNLLPTDGGVITIQGAGAIYKLFPIQNGMLVFASNGVWFITGSQGIGFSANDYTITKISSIRSMSTTSFVDVSGLPYFWNEEGIYAVQPAQGGGLTVNPLTVGTILSFYNNIPLSSKMNARGDYNPIDYVVQWVYKDTEAVSTVDKYNFNKILTFNVYNKAFYPYTVDNTNASINGIKYIALPGGVGSVQSGFKYASSFPAAGSYSVQLADEHDTNYVDWASVSSKNFISTFTTGYKIHGQGQKRFQIPYVYTFSRNDNPNSFKIRFIWDYALTGNSGRWSSSQRVNNWSPNFGVVFRRHKLRGRGLVLQIQFTSVDGQPFDIIGWSIYENLNTGV